MLTISIPIPKIILISIVDYIPNQVEDNKLKQIKSDLLQNAALKSSALDLV